MKEIPKLAYFVKHPFADDDKFELEVFALLKATLSKRFRARKVLKRWVFGS